MPNGIDTFPHDARAHKHWKFEKLRERHGWAGEGRFWALNGIIATSSACCLDLSDPGVVPMLCHELSFQDESELRSYLGFLESDCHLLRGEGTVITTGMVQQQLARRTQKAMRNREDYERRKVGAEKLPIAIPPPPDPATEERRSAQQLEREQLERRFAAWWALYPVKRDKPKSKAKYMVLARKPEFCDIVDAGLQVQINERAEREAQGYWNPPWKYPRTWLNAEAWNDDPLPKTPDYLISNRHNGPRHNDKPRQGAVSTTGTADVEV